ncbi:MAG: hypothetical protein ACPHM3_05345 [Candidatus Kariarchaeum pelagius]
MKTITKEQWRKTHKDYKSMIDGQPYVLEFIKGKGTCLSPVKIEGDN